MSTTHRNEVLLVGRLSAEPEVRELPSGDEITTWRLVVHRDYVAEGRSGQDTIDCTAWTRPSPSKWARVRLSSGVGSRLG